MTNSRSRLLTRLTRKAARVGGTPPTKLDLAALCAWAREMDAALALIAAYGRDTALPCSECAGQESHDRHSCPFAWAEGARR